MKVQPGVMYTLEEVAMFKDDPDVAKLAEAGYVLEQSLETGQVCFTHWSKAGGHQGKEGNVYGQPAETVFDKTELPPANKRTGAQRMASLMDKVGDDLRHYLSGQAGRVVTGDETRQVAQSVMDDVDRQFEETESKRIVRTTGNPYA